MSKEYGIETKLEQEQWGGGGSTWEILLGGRMTEFSAGGGGTLGTPPSPQWGKPCFKETRKSSY